MHPHVCPLRAQWGNLQDPILILLMAAAAVSGDAITSSFQRGTSWTAMLMNWGCEDSRWDWSALLPMLHGRLLLHSW